MANIRSAKKRIRQDEKRQIRNRQYRSAARTYIKKARRLMAEGQIEEAEAAVYNAVRTLDKAASKGIIHPRNAARRKSRLMSQFAALKQNA